MGRDSLDSAGRCYMRNATTIPPEMLIEALGMGNRFGAFPKGDTKMGVLNKWVCARFDANRQTTFLKWNLLLVLSWSLLL